MKIKIDQTQLETLLTTLDLLTEKISCLTVQLNISEENLCDRNTLIRKQVDRMISIMEKISSRYEVQIKKK